MMCDNVRQVEGLYIPFDGLCRFVHIPYRDGDNFCSQLLLLLKIPFWNFRREYISRDSKTYESYMLIGFDGVHNPYSARENKKFKKHWSKQKYFNNLVLFRLVNDTISPRIKRLYALHFMQYYGIESEVESTEYFFVDGDFIPLNEVKR